MKKMKFLNLASATFAAAAFTVAVPATTRAAFISIDDSDINTMTISAGDFEGGISIDGNLLTIGLGNSASITLSDTGHSITGSWIDLGLSLSQVMNIFFADPSAPAAVTSGITLTANTDGFFGLLGGSSSTGGYNGVPYFITADPTYSQNGPTQSGSLPFLSVSFTPEHNNGVPDSGSSVALLGLAFTALAFARRSRS